MMIIAIVTSTSSRVNPLRLARAKTALCVMRSIGPVRVQTEFEQFLCPKGKIKPLIEASEEGAWEQELRAFFSLV
jgi:hypothetical protein